MLKKHFGDLTYFAHGNDPKLLLMSGMHGDEYEVIAPVQKYIENHLNTLPSFIYIPQVSPSAVAQKTRKNAFNHDINRSFKEPPDDLEAQNIMNLLTPYHFELGISFHEDPELTQEFYIYDNDVLSENQLANLRKKILETGSLLYTGIDDEADIDLGMRAEEGYISAPYTIPPSSSGFACEWLLWKHIVPRAFDPEIPGKAPLPLKERLVEAIFDSLLPLIHQS